MSSTSRKLTIKNLINNEENSSSNILETARDFEKVDLNKYFGPLVSKWLGRWVSKINIEF